MIEEDIIEKIVEKIDVDSLIEKLNMEILTDKIAEKVANYIINKEFPKNPIQPDIFKPKPDIINPATPLRTDPWIPDQIVMYGCTPTIYTTGDSSSNETISK